MMTRINWREKLGWSDDQLEELRITGYAYIRQGKYDIALNIFNALHILDPDSAYDTQTLGAIYLELNQPQEAIKCFDQALKLEGDHAPTLLNLCKALFMMNRAKEAVRLAEILQNEPDPRISSVATALLLAYSDDRAD